MVDVYLRFLPPVLPNFIKYNSVIFILILTFLAFEIKKKKDIYVEIRG
jgi:hypothetical protein